MDWLIGYVTVGACSFAGIWFSSAVLKKKKWTFWMILTALVLSILVWPINLGWSCYYMIMRERLLIMMTVYFQKQTAMDWKDCRSHAVTTLTEAFECQGLEVFKPWLWTQETAEAIVDEELSCWEHDAG